MAYTIVIIGSGQLGSRHLQGVLAMNLPLNVEVLDPNFNSLLLAKERALEIPLNKNILSIKYLSRIEELTTKIDLCIISTNSDIRLKVISDLVLHASIKNILLEKILFQNITDYTEAKNIFTTYSIKVWVNCPRRMYQIYKAIKNEISSIDKITVTVLGGEWGLACNSIHFLDLFAFLTEDNQIDYNTEGITKVVKSKRLGFYEFGGSIFVKNKNSSELLLHSRLNNQSTSIINIISNNNFWTIDEGLGKIYTNSNTNNWITTELNFAIPYQSKLTNIVCENILLNERCDLPTFEDSKEIHKNMILEFTKIFSLNGIDVSNGCPIT